MAKERRRHVQEKISAASIGQQGETAHAISTAELIRPTGKQFSANRDLQFGENAPLIVNRKW